MPVEQRDVHDFHEVVMQDIGTLVITQGAQEALTVDTDLDLKDIYTEVRDGVLKLWLGRDLMDRLSIALGSALSSQRVHYRLSVKQLDNLTLAGAGQVDCAALTTSSLRVRLSGVGSVSLQALVAQELDVELTGAGQVRVAGKAQQQLAHVSGVGSYDGAALESQCARVHMSGSGRAVVWAEQELEADLGGVGVLQYRGNPRLKQRVRGLGSISRLGEGPQTRATGPSVPPRPPKPPLSKG